jgi:tetratricopeptide (TPR) repeat protein
MSALRAFRPVLAGAWLATLAACTTLTSPRYPESVPPIEPSAPVPPSPAPPSRAPSPAPNAPGAPSRPRGDSSGATQELLQQSRAARASGNYGQATATTERALRIAPNDPALWLELGEIALATGDTRQAATLARKALSLAADDRAVSAQAERLLRAAGGR